MSAALLTSASLALPVLAIIFVSYRLGYNRGFKNGCARVSSLYARDVFEP